MHSLSSPLNLPGLASLAFLQVFISAMVYGPLGAYLVESFPTRIRFTSLAITYGVGTGDIGDGTLLIAPWLATVTGNIFAGFLWIAAVPMAALVGGIRFMRETRGIQLSDEARGTPT
jgi:MFS family permease